MAASFYISINSTQHFPFSTFSPTFITAFFMIPILLGVRWHLTVVLNWISQVISDVEHRLFFCTSSLEKCLFISSANFLKIRLLFLLLLLSCLSSSHILDINSLSDIWFPNMFSHSPICFSFCYIFLWKRLLVWWNSPRFLISENKIPHGHIVYKMNSKIYKFIKPHIERKWDPVSNSYFITHFVLLEGILV